MAGEEARAPVRPGQRARCCAPACCGWRTRSTRCSSPCTTSSRDGWSHGLLVREVSALYGAFSRGEALAPGGAAGAVRGLRGLAARVAARRGAGGAAGLLARRPWPARRPCWSCPRTARAPRAPSDRGASVSFALPAETLPRRAGAGAPRGRHAVHDPAGRLAAAPGALQRPGRRERRRARGRPHADGDGGAHRLLRQHAGAARRTCPARPASASCWAACATRTLGAHAAPGPALREAGGGAGAGARPGPHAALPGAVRPARTTRGRRCRRWAAWAPRRWHADAESAKFDLTLALMETEDGLARLARATARTCSTRRRWSGWRRTRGRCSRPPLAQPERAAADIPFLADDERRRVLAEWNATERPYAAGYASTGCSQAQAAARRRTPSPCSSRTRR